MAGRNGVLLAIAGVLSLWGCAPADSPYQEPIYMFVPGPVAYVPIHCPCPPDCIHYHEYGYLYPDHFDSEGRHVNSRGIGEPRPRQYGAGGNPEPVVTTTDLPRAPDVPVVREEPAAAPAPTYRQPKPRVPVKDIAPKKPKPVKAPVKKVRPPRSQPKPSTAEKPKKEPKVDPSSSESKEKPKPN